MKRILSVLSILCLVTGTVHAKYPTPDFGTIYIPWKGSSSTPNITSGLTHWYKFDEGTGTTAIDAGSAPQNGTLTNGPAYSAAQVGAFALTFDGTNDYVSIPYDPYLITTYSFSAWFKTSSTNLMAIIDTRIANSTGVVLYLDPNGYINAYWYTPNVALIGSVNLHDGAWHHVVLSVLPTAQKLYVDGVQVATAANSISGAANIHSTTYIGAVAGVAYPWQGVLDDVRIYNTALSASDVTVIYNYR